MEVWSEGARAIVVGCGGVGGTVIAKLHEAGRHVVAVSGNAEITRAIGERGLRASVVDGGEKVVRVNVVTKASTLPPGPYDIAFLAVPPNRLEEAARDVLPFLGDRGVLVPFANGLPEERLAAKHGEQRVVGGIVGFGASMLSPGVV